MITAELLTEKFQSILGKQYKVFANHAFNQKFTNPLETPYGTAYDFNYQAFEKDADYIIAVLKTTPTTLTNTPYVISAERYTLSFYVPLDQVRMDEKGRVLEMPEFDFYGDFERLDEALRNKEVRLNDFDGIEYRTFFTLSQPTLAANQVENGNGHTRCVYQVEGNVSISNIAVGTGGNIEIAFKIDDKWETVPNIANLIIGATDEASDSINQSKTTSEQDVAIRSQSVSFSVDDYVKDSPAMWLIEDKVILKKEMLTPNAPRIDQKRKIKTRLTKRSMRSGTTATTITREFWGILSVQYTVNGKAGFGGYQVNIADDGKE